MHESPSLLERLVRGRAGGFVRAHGFASVLATACAVVLLAGCSDRGTAPSSVAAPLPNIVVIVTDDQAFASLPYMPIVARELRAAGTTFSNFILSDPICCPSRVTMLLGQYRHNHQNEFEGSLGCAFRFFEAGDQHRSIGRLLQTAGYRTGYFGKFLNSYDTYLKWGGERAAEDPLLTGWDEYAVLSGPTRYYEFEFHTADRMEIAQPGLHQNDWLTMRAVAFLRASTEAGRPFFLFVAPQAPHGPVVPAARHRGQSEHLDVPHPASFDRADPSQPSLAHTRPLDAARVREIDDRFRAHVEVLQSVDELVGRIVDTLDDLGVLSETWVFFTSDNGLHFGEHRIHKGKATPFEESIRFPLIVRGPGVPTGVERAELVSNTDLHPTLLALAGLTPAADVDGRSLLPLFSEAGAPWRRALLIESAHPPRNSGVPTFVGIRSDRYKWIRYGNGAVELYDLSADPRELRNIAGEAPDELIQRLESQLDALIACHGAECLTVEDGVVD